MNPFRNLFGEKTENYATFSKKVNSVLDLFKIDLTNLPSDIFTEGEEEINISGDKITNYRAILNYLECGLFDTITVKRFDHGSYNVIFEYYGLSEVKMDRLKKLIDSLFLLYGTDDLKRGRFTNIDLDNFKSANLCMLTGRIWLEMDKYQYPVMLGVDNNSDIISLTIFGIKGIKEIGK